MDELRNRGNLAEGVWLDQANGGRLRVVFCRSETLVELAPELKGGSGDNNILAVALVKQMLGGMAGSEGLPGGEAPGPDRDLVVLVTKDTNLRIKADAVGLIAQDYTTGKVDIATLYSGSRELWVPADQMDRVKGHGGLPLAELAA